MLKPSPKTLVDSANRLKRSKEFSVRTVRFASLVVVATLGSIALTGCSVAPESCENPLGEGSASLISVEGSVGSAPTVDFPTPFVGRDSSTAVVLEGSGDPITTGDFVDFEATVYRGTDKLVLTATPYGLNGAPAQRIPIAAESNTLTDSFLCHRAGERFTLTGTAEDIFGPAAAGLTPTETVVVVFDVMDVYPPAASGTPQFGLDGMPAVTSAPDGRPGIAVPNIAPPTELRISTLIKGDGPEIAEGDDIVAHYLGVIWGGGVFDSTWEKGRPADLVAQSFIDNGGSGVVPGFAKAVMVRRSGRVCSSLFRPQRVIRRVKHRRASPLTRR
jgi:peptidylprolyl isomerase